MKKISTVDLVVLILAVFIMVGCQQPGELETKGSFVALSEKPSQTDSTDETMDTPNNDDGSPIQPPPQDHPPKGNPPKDHPPTAETPPGDNNDLPADLVECQLEHPNTKVTLATAFAPGPNASSTRVCMSRNACLNIVNAYVNVRNCALSSGGPTHPGLANDQCTEIFPGSKGTCHNAKYITDAEVTAILTEMAK